ncbi:MAG: glycosyltransferase family 4 protein [Paludibacter sp.]
MKKTKVLIFHPHLAPYRIDQFNSLNELYELEVVFLFDNLLYYKMDQSKLLLKLLFKASFLLIGPRYKWRVFRFGMLRKIKEMNPDIILGYEYSLTTQYLVLLKRIGLISQKIGSAIDDSMDICNRVQSRTRFIGRKLSIKHLDFIVVLSNEVAQFYHNTFNLREDQIIVSPILQKPENLRNEPEKLENTAQIYTQKYQLKGKKVLLFVGRFVPEKGLQKFLNSIHSIILEQENLIFVLVGSGKEIQALKVIVEEKKLEEKVIFPGKYEGQELYAWYLCASGFVLPSLYEPFGAVVNEALIFGLKVLCSQHAGAACLIKPDNGMVFSPLDSEDTIEKMKLFLNVIDNTEEINLKYKPSLMTDNKQDFIKEWKKLASY